MGPLTLKQFQRLFNQATCQGLSDDIPAELLATFAPGGTLLPRDALNVYANGHLVRLTESLGETFEGVWWVCGDKDFFRLARRYIVLHPSTTYNLSHYGQRFPEFLDEVLPFPDLPFLGPLARFEWLFQELFHTGQHQSLAPNVIQSAAQDTNVCFDFGEGVRFFTSPYAVYDLWKLRDTPHEGSPPVPWDHPQSLILYKQEHQIFVKEISLPEYALLTALRQGVALENALLSTLECYPNLSQEQISALFQLIVHTGIIKKITQPASHSAFQGR